MAARNEGNLKGIVAGTVISLMLTIPAWLLHRLTDIPFASDRLEAAENRITTENVDRFRGRVRAERLGKKLGQFGCLSAQSPGPPHDFDLESLSVAVGEKA